MRLSFMRRVDNWVGVPLCLALGALEAVRRVVFGPPPSVDPASARRVLVTKFLGVGSIAEAVPMFGALRRRHPGARLSFLTFSPCAEFARLLGTFDEVRVIRTASVPSFVRDSLAAIAWGRRRGFDVSYDLEFFSKYSYVMSYVIHARNRVGYFVRVLRYVQLLTHPVPYNARRHVAEAFLAQLDPEPARLLPTGPSPLALPERAEDEARRLLDRFGMTDDPCLVAMNVNTSDLSTLRLWPAEYYAELAGRLAKAYGASFLFVGGPQDRGRVEAVLARTDPAIRVANVAGLTSLAGLLALFKRVRLVVSNDSGPLHLAALVGAPTVAFFGAESARVYGPRGSKHVNLDRELYCSPCLNVYNFKEFDCPYGVRCLKELTPQAAYEAAAALLGEPPSEPARRPALHRAACPVCGHASSTSRLVGRGIGLTFCDACGFARQNPLPTREWLVRLYGEEYYDAWGLRRREEEVRAMKRATFRRWLVQLERARGGRAGKVLDLGCATGFFLEEAAARGWDASGVELSAHAGGRARERFGDRVHIGQFRAARYPGASFDAVTMFDYVEHLDDLDDTLAEVARILKPGGWLALTTPDVASPSCRWMGAGWMHWKDEHLIYFTPAAMRLATARAGLELTVVKRAWKSVDLGYGATHFSRFPHRLITPLVRTAEKVLPQAVWKLRVTVPLGEMFALARKR